MGIQETKQAIKKLKHLTGNFSTDITKFRAQIEEKFASYDEVKAAMKEVANGELKGSLGYTEEKVVSWYDNERGYSSKVVEMVKVMATN